MGISLGSLGSALGGFATGGWTGALGGFLTAQGQHNANQQKLGLTKEQMELQKESMYSGYQIAANDLKKAGINPILAGKWGPASYGSTSIPEIGNVGMAGMQGVNTAQQSMKAQHEMDKIDQEISNILSDTFLKVAQKSLTETQTEVAAQTVREVAENVKAKTFENYINEIRATLHANNHWLMLMQETGTTGGSIAQLTGALIGSLAHVLRGLFQKQLSKTSSTTVTNSPKGRTSSTTTNHYEVLK